MKRILDKIAAIRTNPNAFEEWRDYRRQLTDVVISATTEGDTLAVYGAGSCNDIDLDRRVRQRQAGLVQRQLAEWPQNRARGMAFRMAIDEYEIIR